MITLPFLYEAPQEALDAITALKNSSISYLAGRAGTGKSSFIEYLRRECSDPITKRMVVLAPTGIAALNIGAQTIHSFFKIAPHDRPGKPMYQQKETKIMNMSLLVIDEISMVRADLLDLIDEHMRYHRSNNQPFGGCPVLCVGDLFQLPPVVSYTEMQEFYSRYPCPWFFYANVFGRVNLSCFELMKVHRQKDKFFLDILNDVRLAKNLDKTLPLLNQATDINIPLTMTPMHLTSLNKAADQYNMEQLAMINMPAMAYNAIIGAGFTEADIRNMQSGPHIELKVGARVMCTTNLPSSFETIKVVNGNLGWVTAIEPDRVLVQYDDLGERWMTQHTWEKVTWDFDSGKSTFTANIKGRYTQIPLRVGYAVSIHKSQGLTLESAIVDLGERAFASGQAYVALSRCRTLEGLRLSRPLHPQDLVQDQAVLQFYEWKFGSGELKPLRTEYR